MKKDRATKAQLKKDYTKFIVFMSFKVFRFDEKLPRIYKELNVI